MQKLSAQSKYTIRLLFIGVILLSIVALKPKITVEAQSANLALNKPVVASSSQSGLTAAAAVDGNTATRWGSDWSDPQWIYVDLGVTYTVTRVKLTWEAAYATAFQIQVSNDASNWTPIYSTTTGTGGVQDLTGLSGSGRYVRMYGTVRATGWGYSLYEFEVYSGTTPTNTATFVPPTVTRTSTQLPTATSGSGGCGTTNVALNKTATSSSNEAPGTLASYAVDGDLTSRWGSAFSDPQWLQVDLGATMSICRVKISWETAYGSAFQIQVSNDATNWTNIYATTNGTGGVQDLTGLSGSGRYVRMYGTARGTAYGYSIWEFEVYSGTNNITGTPTRTSTATATLAGTTPAGGLAVTINVPVVEYLAIGLSPADLNGTNLVKTQNTSQTATVYYNSGTSVTFSVSAMVSGVGQTATFSAVDQSGVTHTGSPLTMTVFSGLVVNVILINPTPTATSVSCGTTNVALNKTATASSATGANTAAMAFDGNAGTRWESAYSDPQWLQVDLGSTYALCHVTLNWETAAAASYQIQVSPDATNWTTIYSTTTGVAGITDIGVSGSGRYVRMNGTVRTTQYGYSIWEFGIFAVGVGPTATTAPASATPTMQSTPTLTPTPIPAFSLISPANGTVITNTRRPTLTWNPLAGSTSYQVWLNITRTDYDWTAPGSLLERYTLMATVTGTNYTLTTDLADRWTYKWYVIAVNGSGQQSTSNTLTFSVYLPVVTTVNDGIPLINGMRDLNKDGTIEPYEDWHQPISVRVNDLLSRMTVQEEAFQMFYNAQAFPMSGWYFGPGQPQDLYNTQLTTAKTRLGIPFIAAGDTNNGYITTYPTELGLAASRDYQMSYLLGDMQRREENPVGERGLLGPLAEVDTKVLYPRFQEGSGENADLAAAMTRAKVTGLQGGPELNPASSLVTVKHWPGEGAGGEAGITFDGTSILYHMRPWRAAFEAGAGSIMTGYAGSQYLDPGGPGAGNSAPIINYLRVNMGYDGLVVTDWLPYGAWISAANAGADVMGGADPGVTGFDMNTFIASVPKSRIDQAVTRILTVKFKMGIFENPYGDPVNGIAGFHTPANNALITQAAKETMTLLKNTGVLPLRLNAGATLLVTGARANDGPSCCIWTSYFHPEYGSLTMWQAIQQRAQQAGVNAYLDTTPTTPNAAIVIVGEASYTHATDWNINTPYLPADQLTLIQNLTSQGIPTVVVYTMPRPYVITTESQIANAIVVAYRSGEGGGPALAQLLFGDYLPSGKLPMQLPHDMNQVGTDTQTNQLERWDLPYDLGATDADRQTIRTYIANGQTVPTTFGQPLYPFGAGIQGFGLTDGTPPVAFSLTGPATGSTVQNTLPTLTWGASSDPETGIQQYQVWLDGVNIAQTKATQYALTNVKLAAGTHSWYVVAVNWANGTTKSSNTFTFNFQDTAAPNVFDLVSPFNASTVSGSSQTLVWESSYDPGAGLDHYEVWVDNVNVANLTSAGQLATGTNLALNMSSTSSSTQVATNGPSMAFDGSLTTRWESQYSDPQWLQVDLGKPTEVNHVKLTWETAYATAYKIQVSNDGTTWTDIYSTTTGTGGVNDLTGLKGYGRYVRMYGTARATGYGYSIYEFEVYGNPTETYVKTGLTSGTHTWYIVAVDAFGNKRKSTSTYTFTTP
jgi:beta-glucosidase-like glycosyl hydrolase